MRGARVLIAAAALGGCDALPRDPDGTSDRVRAGQVMRVGMVDGVVDREDRAVALVDLVAKAAGARPVASHGPLEPLLLALEQGRLDLVVGPFAHDTPWQARVALAPPLAQAGGEADRFELRAAMKSGENRWIVLVERASRTVARAGTGR